MSNDIPKEVRAVVNKLEAAGFEAFVVGGCVRDILLGRKPRDWDITTNAPPDKITGLFPESVYENSFGTVSIFPEDSEDESARMIEVTPYRTEEKYSDKRHPDSVKFARTLDEDLSRRDFTINAMALDVASDAITDLFEGKKDFKAGLIRAVGAAEKRFDEDPLRIMRAVRLASELNFAIEHETENAIASKAGLLRFVSKERIRDEFTKLIASGSPSSGLERMRVLGVLKLVAPEIEEGYGVGQNKHHIYTVWEHNMRALEHAASKNWPLEVRMAALLHDVGKPRSKRGEGVNSTFYGHEIIGAKMAAELLGRLKYSNDFIEYVSKLVRYHLFYYNVDEVGEASVRRLIRKVGPENMNDLIHVRICDRIGSGVPKEEPYKLRHFKFVIEKLARDPISVRMLKINGDHIMKLTGLEPGPKIGMILGVLLEDVLDDPKRNKKKYLMERARELARIGDSDLQKLARDAKKKSSALEEEEVGKIKQKHWVK